MYQATNIALITIHLPKENRGRALGIVSTAVALGGMTGPIAGGFIAEWFSWQWIFLIHVPVAIVATWLAFRYIPAIRLASTYDPLDRFGAFSFITMIGSFILGISNGHTWGWLSVSTISTFMIALFALFFLLFWEFRQKSPFLPIHALRIPAVSIGLLISCVSFVLATAVLVIMPFYLSEAFGLSPLFIGYIMTAYPLLLALAGPFAGHWSDRYGSRLIMLLGLCGMGGGLFIFALFLGDLPIGGIVTSLALIGTGMGLVASPTNSFIMHNVPRDYVGSIGGMIALSRNTGMVLGAALGLSIS